MNFIVIGMLIMQAARLACGTCVLESDFGFILNCNFKKSGLFRVRNLGGLKAHFGLGFSLGDELGFPESLGNLEGNRKRAISYKNGAPIASDVLPAATQQGSTSRSIAEKRVAARAVAPSPYNPGNQDVLNRNQVATVPLMTEARPLPLGVPAFRPIPKTTAMQQQQMAQRRSSIAVDTTKPRVSVNNKLVDSYSKVRSNHTFHVTNPMVSQPLAVPPFQSMPDSVKRITMSMKKPNPNQMESRIVQQQHHHYRPQQQQQQAPSINPNYLQFEEPKFDLKDVTVEELAAAANVSVETIRHAIYVREQQMKAEHRAMLAAKLREEFIRTSTTSTTTTSTTTTTTTTTPRPLVYLDPEAAMTIAQNIAHENKISKVMNAPKEYYPVGYDKNFDDNFKSKVDLPPTSFTCGKQKHFPGLYADTDLACMVFHVCALTDDGLVRKSFLCPENTLFDQTILKCNWWFYVDCSASKSVYDSNIPISKSYQLMKSLTYFSKYNKHKDGAAAADDDDDNYNGNNDGLDIQTLKETMKEATRNQDHANTVDKSVSQKFNDDNHQSTNEA